MNAEDSQHDEPERAGEPGADDRQTSEIEAAAEAVRRAKEQLKEARCAYWRLRRRTVEQLRQVREMSLGDVVESTLKQVQRRPGPSVVVAMLAGFFLGRLFRR